MVNETTIEIFDGGCNLHVVVILVLYYPNIDKVIGTIKNLIQEGHDVVAIDNTPLTENESIKKIAETYVKFYYIPLFKNMGVADAYNKGIEYAKSLSYTHVLFLDQDSYLESYFVNSMCSEYFRIAKTGIQIGVLSPILINQKTGKAYKRKILNRGTDYYITDKVSSSGSLISSATLDIVGNMEASLFIDLVDSEWCWRARKFGFYTCITNRVKMLHTIGEDNKKVFGYRIIVSAPMRYYYQYRNWIRMLFRSYVPMDWKIKTSIKYFLFLIYYPIFIKNGIGYFRFMVRGVKDAFKTIE